MAKLGPQGVSDNLREEVTSPFSSSHWNILYLNPFTFDRQETMGQGIRDGVRTQDLTYDLAFLLLLITFLGLMMSLDGCLKDRSTTT